MKFDNAIATGVVTGSCIGAIFAEILIHPPMIVHLWCADMMLVTAILLGILFGGQEQCS